MVGIPLLRGGMREEKIKKKNKKNFFETTTNDTNLTN